MSISFAEDFIRWDQSPQKDIVTVHGLSGSNAEPWCDSESTSGKRWLEQDLFAASRSRVLVFSYTAESDIDKNIFSNAGVSELAGRLLRELMDWRKTVGEPRRPLAFICQDFGATIVKKALAFASTDPQEYTALLQATFALVFVNSPHRPLNYDQLSDDNAELLVPSRKDWYNKLGVIKTANLMASTVIAVNNAFLECGILLRVQVVNVYATTTPTTTCQARFFDRMTATMDWCSETPIGVPASSSLSSSLLCGEEGRECYSKIRRVLEIWDSDVQALWPIDTDLNVLNFLVSQAAPIHLDRPPADVRAADAVHSSLPLDQLALWTQGRSDPDHDHHQAVHIVDFGSYPPLLLGYILRYLNATKEEYGVSGSLAAIFTFTFRKDDPRANTVEAALASLVVQAVSFLFPRLRKDERSELCLAELLGKQNARLSSTEIHSLFQCVNRWFAQRAQRVAWVVWKVDECSERIPVLIDRLLSSGRFSEVKPFLLFETTREGSEAISSMMEPFSLRCLEMRTVIAQQHSQITTSPESTISLVADNLTRKYPWVLLTLRNELEACLSGIAENPVLHGMMLRWLPKAIAMGEGAIRSTIARVTEAGAHGLVSLILGVLSDAERKRATRLLQWILYAQRPLSFSEITCILAIDDNEHQARNIDTKTFSNCPGSYSTAVFRIHDLLCGIITVDGNDVAFGHTSFPSIFMDLEPLNEQGPNNSHNYILSCLLDLLVTEAVCREHDDSRARVAPAALLPYAASFWAHHYRQAASDPATKPDADRRLMRFLSQEGYTTAAVHLALETACGTFASVGPICPEISLLASSGLDVAAIANLLQNEWTADENAMISAIVGALRGGQTLLLEELLSTFMQQQLSPGLWDTVLGETLLCDNADVFSVIASSIPDGMKIPFEFLGKAVELSIKPVVSQAIDGFYHLPPGQDWNELPVRALRLGELETVKLLIENRTQVNLTDDTVNELLTIASQGGDPKLVSALLDIDTGDSFRSLLENLGTACRHGNYQVVEIILESLTPASREHGKHSSESWRHDLGTVLTTVVCNGLSKCTAAILAFLDKNKELAREVIQPALHEGVAKAQVEACAQLLEYDVAKSLLLDDDEHLLAEAVPTGNLTLVKVLIDHGARIDGVSSNYSGYTPLQLAASEGRVPMLKLFLDSGADVNCSSGARGQTPLFCACIENKADAVELLLQRGADPQLETGDTDWSPLEAAYDFPDCVQHLVRNTKRPPDFRRQVKSSDGGRVTALYLAALGNHVRCVELLLDEGDPELDFVCVREHDGYSDYGFTPLTAAAWSGNTEVVRLLLEHGANINHLVNGKTHLLKYVDKEETLAALLEFCPDLGSRDASGMTVLHSHCNRNDVSEGFLRRLINAGAHIEAAGEKERTPLGVAALAANETAVRVLLAKGANVHGNREEPWGGPIFLATCFGGLACTRMLVEKGADIHAAHPYCGTPLQYACGAWQDEFEIVKYLVGRGANVVSPRGSRVRGLGANACLLAGIATIRLLADVGCNFLEVDRASGVPPVFFACIREDGAISVIDELRERGADISPETRDVTGRTILHWAVASHNTDLVLYLLEAEPGLISAVDRDGWSALHWALRRVYLYNHERGAVASNDGRHIEVVQLLLDKNCPGLEEPVSAGRRKSTLSSLATYWGAPSQVQDIIAKALAVRTGSSEIAAAEGKERSTAWEKIQEDKVATRSGARSETIDDAAQTAPAQGLVETENGGVTTEFPMSKTVQSEINVPGKEKEPYGPGREGSLEESRTARCVEEWSCDGCYCELRGILYLCRDESCQRDYGLCVKCFEYKDLVHDKTHSELFIAEGDEYD